MFETASDRTMEAQWSVLEGEAVIFSGDTGRALSGTWDTRGVNSEARPQNWQDGVIADLDDGSSAG